MPDRRGRLLQCFDDGAQRGPFGARVPGGVDVAHEVRARREGPEVARQAGPADPRQHGDPETGLDERDVRRMVLGRVCDIRLALVLLGSVSTAACFAGFTWLAGNVGPVRASAVTYAVPVIALAVGVLAGGEAVAPVAVGGVVLVLAAAYLVQRPERPDIPAARSG
jgi:hypothetical protein